MKDAGTDKSGAESNGNVADMSADDVKNAEHAVALAERHRAATLVSLRASTSEAARLRHARKSWGRR